MFCGILRYKVVAGGIMLNLLKNIPKGFKLLCSVRVFKHYIKDLEAARAVGDFEKERAVVAEGGHRWASTVADMFDMRINVVGIENIPKDGAVVFISNHQGYADIPAFFYALKDRSVGFVAKDNFEKIPYLRKLVGYIRGVFIKRGDPREALKSINEGVETLKQGFSLVIFPEGTRSRGGEMKDFKPGSFKLATKAKVPIVPVTINGTYKIFEETGVIKGGDVDFVFHPAIDTASLDRHQIASLIGDVEGTIRTTLDQLVLKDKMRNEKE